MQGDIPSTPRGHGDGDGIRQKMVTNKKGPISSAKKVKPRSKDEPMKLKLQTVNCNVTGRKPERVNTPCKQKEVLVKSASVAEITPTKAKKRLSMRSVDDNIEIYATPRLLSDFEEKLFCLQERNTCRVYRRLMLLAWRKSRDSAKAKDELLKKQELQILQLDLQVDVLNKLREAESQKREEAQTECQKLKKSIDLLELENGQLNEETQNLQTTLEIIQNELKVAKAENNFLSDQSTKLQEVIGKKKSENRFLEEKVKLYDEEKSTLRSMVSNLECKIKFLEKNLKTTEQNYRMKENKYTQLKCEFKKQLDTNKSVTKQLEDLKNEKINVSIKVEDLESQLNNYIQSCELLKEANVELNQEMHEMSIELEEEKKHNWLKNTKHFALLSLSALQKVADVVLPAYLDGPANF
ncbi:cingulin-like [Anthonomus grandis grandis]|uniref:cingulin-like n=1 Tax=Anthonomus grandis grandis TaxID=2921223 RepID=UPI002165238F|nr:cingulin-like [Anthonomus grandis grandis]